MRETGLKNLKAFLLRVVEQLAPGVERVRDEIRKRYPEAETAGADHAPAHDVR